MGMPEVELGWIPPWAVGRLVDVVGSTNARWLALACVRLNSEEAQAMHLVSAVTPDSELRTYTSSFAAAASAFEACYGSAEAQANVAAFLARKQKG